MSDALRPTPEDALAAWAARVRANREQAERVREGEAGGDFYAPIAANFRADPRRTDEPVLDAIRELVVPGERWLDIGAGGGRYSLPIALVAGEVVAVDPSQGMLGILREGMADHGIANVRIVESRWPMAEMPSADVAFISHVGYDIEEIGPFLDAMESAASRLCVAVLLARQPPYLAEPFWPLVHGEERQKLPALPEFLALLLARGRLFDLKLVGRTPQAYGDAALLEAWLHQQLFIQPGGAKSGALMAAARAQATERAGRWALSWEDTPVGVVTWRPGGVV